MNVDELGVRVNRINFQPTGWKDHSAGAGYAFPREGGETGVSRSGGWPGTPIPGWHGEQMDNNKRPFSAFRKRGQSPLPRDIDVGQV